MAALPTISIVIPTYNCAGLLRETLASLASQDYPRAQLELLAVDGGSTDGTRALLAENGFRIIENPLRSNLYGLPLAFREARGELVLHLDDDNVLDRPEWLRRMVEPFADLGVVAAEPLFYAAPAAENELTRYISLLGADDPLVVSAGFHDKFSFLTNSWTDVPRSEEDRGTHIVVAFSNARHIPTLACNAFLVRREILREVVRTPWLHIDGAVRILAQGGRKWAKVRVGIVNHHTPGVLGFFIKKTRRLRTRSREAISFEYQYPVTRRELLRIVVRCLLLLPLVVDALRGFWRRPDPVWLLHPLLTLGTLGAYGGTYLHLFFSKAPKSAPLRLVSRSENT